MPPHEISPVLCSMNFADNFWGREQKGVKTLLARMRHAKETCEDVRHMYEARALAAEEYSRKLQRIQKSKVAKDDTGNVKKSLQSAQEDAQTEAQHFQQLAQTIRVELGVPLAEFVTKQREARKLIQKAVQDVYNQRQLQIHYVLRARDKYNNECMRIKTLREDKENQKAALARAAASAKTLYAEYESSLAAAQESIQLWNREWQASCEKFQNLEEERINFLRESLSQFAYLQMTYAQSQVSRWESLLTSVNGWDCRDELNTYVSDHGTGRDIPEVMDYMILYEQQESDKSAATNASEKDVSPPSPILSRQGSITEGSMRSTMIPVAVKMETPPKENNIQMEDVNEQRQMPSPQVAPSPMSNEVFAKETHGRVTVSDKQSERRRDSVRRSMPVSNLEKSQGSFQQGYQNGINRRASVLEIHHTTPANATDNNHRVSQNMNVQQELHQQHQRNQQQEVRSQKEERSPLVRVSSSRPIKVDLKDVRGSLNRNPSFATVSSTDSKSSAKAHSSLENILQRFETGQIGRGTNRIRDTLKERAASRRPALGTWQSGKSGANQADRHVSLREITSRSMQSPTFSATSIDSSASMAAMDDYNGRYSRQGTPKMIPQQKIIEEPQYENDDPYGAITGVGRPSQEDHSHDSNQTIGSDEDENPHTDLESQLDDMISLLNDGIDYQLELAKEDSPELSPKAQPSIQNDRAIMWVQALFDYEAEDDEELTFTTGDLIAVVDTGDGDWWHGELWDTETNSCMASGTVPSNYVEEVDVA
ncbi:hypothetical protein K450DRAFT_262956 [Umbelopsis ramanniana AG]|uniref:SH3 domain-containing protein n=1 Tax=Umbelopsis ramanniana AG TaxID=1314678 RepID=A0AAD5H9U6_UMBRA|nr:uncharacterized protein K450DRAFT_262956 [Umbelopsis ramanniana AG]KAI8575189.1 hypothetical protein K450DRAFT_262956 [Umbelopsis ramanniana AG]